MLGYFFDRYETPFRLPYTDYALVVCTGCAAAGIISVVMPAMPVPEAALRSAP